MILHENKQSRARSHGSTVHKQIITCVYYRVGGGARWLGSVLSEPRLADVSFKNEPMLEYRKGSRERAELERALKEMSATVADVPLVIGGEEVSTGECDRVQTMPHDHRRPLARFKWATSDQVRQAADAAVEAQRRWDRDTPADERVRIWLRVADLLSTKYRQRINAATMLGQGKTVVQAEIDSAAELIDFFRASAYTMVESAKYQPVSPEPNVTLNSMRYRGMEGFVAAVSPFNFTAIGGNLAYTPALAGCAVLWKPSNTAVLSNWLVWQACAEAGVPRDVVSFIPADGPTYGNTITAHPKLAAINFTGSVPTFRRLWKQVGDNIDIYSNFPKLVGECGGKNFHLVHRSADVRSVVTATIRSAFEYQGQKCSACSRMYVPRSLWPEVQRGLLAERDLLKVGPPTDWSVFMTAVIDEAAFDRISGYVKHARENLQVLGGGGCDRSKGYFIEPTIVLSEDPRDRIMCEEIFGPLLSIHVYDDKVADVELFRLVDESTAFALTGAVFAKDEGWLRKAQKHLRWAAGNFYVNDKSTGSVVAQQPFGGSRMSGTNDKAGGPQYLLRWTSPQAIKETFVPLRDINYPYMQD